jgi:hypothetical protein
MSINLNNIPNARVLSQRNIRRKSEKYLKNQLGQNVNKDELLRKIANNEVMVTGLITKR